jgi:hypothetical protein
MSGGAKQLKLCLSRECTSQSEDIHRLAMLHTCFIQDKLKLLQHFISSHWRSWRSWRSAIPFSESPHCGTALHASQSPPRWLTAGGRLQRINVRHCRAEDPGGHGVAPILLDDTRLHS